MKRKSKKVVEIKNAKSGKWCIYLIGILVALIVFFGGCYLYVNYVISNIVDENAKSNDPEKQLEFIYDIYDIVEDGLISIILENEYISDLAKLLNSQNSTIQEEATRTLLYLIKKETRFSPLMILQSGYTPLLPPIHSPNEEIAEMALTIIYISSRHEAVVGAKFMTYGLEKNLKKLIDSEPSKKILEIAVSIVSELCQNEYSFLLIRSSNVFQQIFSKLLRHSDDEIIESSLSALLLFTKNTEKKLVFNNEITNILINLLDHFRTNISKNSLKILVHIVNNSFHNSAKAEIITNEIFLQMPNVLIKGQQSVVQIYLSFIYHSVRNSSNYIYAIFEANLIQLIADKLTHQNPLIQRQAAAIISLASHYGKNEHRSTLLNMQIIPKLYNVLVEVDDDEIKRMILYGFDILIKNADDEQRINIYNDFEKINAFKEFSKLLEHKMRLIRNFAQSVLGSVSSEKNGTSFCSKKISFI